MKLKKWLLLNSLLLLGFASIGQAILRIDTSVISPLPQVVRLGEQDSFLVRITNVGSVAFMGQMALSSSINGGQTQYDTTSGSQVQTGVGLVITNDTIQPDSSKLKFVYVNFSGPLFSPGSSVVVIWPLILSGGGRYVDSIIQNVTILDTTTALLTTPDLEKLKVFSVGNVLHIIYAPEIGPAYVRIYDTNGALLTAEGIQDSDTFISLSKYASGCYYVEVTLPDKTRRGYKIFNLNK